MRVLICVLVFIFAAFLESVESRSKILTDPKGHPILIKEYGIYFPATEDDRRAGKRLYNYAEKPLDSKTLKPESLSPPPDPNPRNGDEIEHNGDTVAIVRGTKILEFQKPDAPAHAYKLVPGDFVIRNFVGLSRYDGKNWILQKL